MKHGFDSTTFVELFSSRRLIVAFQKFCVTCLVHFDCVVPSKSILCNYYIGGKRLGLLQKLPAWLTVPSNSLWKQFWLSVETRHAISVMMETCSLTFSIFDRWTIFLFFRVRILNYRPRCILFVRQLRTFKFCGNADHQKVRLVVKFCGLSRGSWPKRRLAFKIAQWLVRTRSNPNSRI